jgi:aminoglycoside phosphotransferase (APT) family kinase protein
MTQLDPYLARAKAMHPGIVVRTARLNTDGGQNVVLIAQSSDGDWVFRFPRDEAGIAAMRRELTLLDALGDRMPIPVPAPLMRTDDAIAYRMLTGVPLTHWLLQSLDEPLQQRLADQMAMFLRCAMP